MINNYAIVRQVLESGICPVNGVIIDIVEFERNKAFGYRLYRENISEFSDNDIQKLYGWLREKASSAEMLSTASVGVDISSLEVSQ